MDQETRKEFRRSIKKTWDVITEKNHPRMVFSIFGNSESFVPKPWQRSIFQAALIESMKNAGASMILYRKGNFEVSNIIEDAVKEYERTPKCDSYSDDKKDNYINLVDVDDKFGKNDSLFSVQLEVEKVINKKCSTYFLTDTEYKNRKFKMRLPMLLVVLEGDIDTVKHVAKAMKRKLPVLLIKGTGKTADLIASFLNDESTMKAEVPRLFGLAFSEAASNKLRKYLRQIKESSYLVNIFDVENDEPSKMSKLAGDVIVKAWSLRRVLTSDESKNVESVVQRISKHEDDCPKITVPDDAYIHFSPSKYTTPTSLPLYFYFGFQFLQKEGDSERAQVWAQNLLLSALLANRTDYVHTLLNKGVTLTMGQIASLYKQKIYKKFAKDMQTGWTEKCENNTTEQGTQKKTKGFEDRASKLCRKLLGYTTKESTSGKCQSKVTDTDTEAQKKSIEEDNQEKLKQLLLWALLSNKVEVAFIVWQKIENHLLTGLVSTAILKRLQAKAARVKEHKLSREIKSHAELFQKRCLELMDAMYTQYPNLAEGLMEDQHTVWSISTTPLQFAHENLMYDVVAHACAQRHLNIKWYGDYHHDMSYVMKKCICCNCKYKGLILAPIAKFLIYYFIFSVVLFAYSAFVLTGIGGFTYERGWNRAWEYTVYAWAAGDIIEEFILILGYWFDQTEEKSKRRLWKRLKIYFYDFWNLVDFLFFFLLAWAFIARHAFRSLDNARRLFSLSLLVMYLRFLEIFLIHNIVGPLLIMFKEMLKDLLYFLVIALVLITGVGVYYHANIWPNHSRIWEGDIEDWRIWDVIYYPFWQMQGEGMNEYLEGRDDTDCTNNYTIWSSDTSAHRCPVMDPTVPVVAAIYVLISNLLLVNLVIAMFSYTFNEVKQNSERLYRYEIYNIITAYQGKCPPPFNIIYRIGWLILKCKECCSPKACQRKCPPPFNIIYRLFVCTFLKCKECCSPKACQRKCRPLFNIMYCLFIWPFLKCKECCSPKACQRKCRPLCKIIYWLFIWPFLKCKECCSPKAPHNDNGKLKDIQKIFANRITFTKDKQRTFQSAGTESSDQYAEVNG